LDSVKKPFTKPVPLLIALAILAFAALSGCARVEDENEQILLVEEIVVALLFVAVLVGIAARRLRVPYTIGLLLMGLILTPQTRFEVNIPPNLILALLVPPLIFEAAFHLNLRDLQHNLTPILALAVPGVILTTLLAGGIVAWGAGLALPAALVFGALVSATDPVSVVSLFRSMGVPKRLQVLLEGESLLNDGTAIVVFRLVVLLAVSGATTFNWTTGLIEFVRIAGGGLAVGSILGWLISQMIGRIDDYLIETTLTSVLAYGAYLLAEAMGVSGVLAVVAAGLISGNSGPLAMSPTTRIVVFNFWEYAAFLANTFVFLLIGLSIRLDELLQNWELILWAIGAVLISRAVTVYGLSWVGRDIPHKWKHVLYWGGLRGAISLALALSLPLSLPSRVPIQAMAFGVVLFTLLIQGLSMAPLVRRLNLVVRSEAQEEYERRHARAVAARSAYEHLDRMHRQGLISEHTWKTLSPVLKRHNESLAEAVREVLTADPSVEAKELDTTRREALRAQRSALTGLLNTGVISEDTYGQLVSEVDAALTEQQFGWPELIGSNHFQRLRINRLMVVIVQEQDVENAISALTKLGISITALPSSGAFLSRRNATLFIGLATGQERAIVRSLQVSCRRRVEYVMTPLEAAIPVLSPPIPVNVGGATIFAFEVERFEVF
jgi:CPA1 family monovalent cation:H+ antiporter